MPGWDDMYEEMITVVICKVVNQPATFPDLAVLDDFHINAYKHYFGRSVDDTFIGW